MPGTDIALAAMPPDEAPPKAERRRQSRRDADPPAWWEQMSAGWRTFIQMGFAGLVAFLFLGTTLGGGYLLWSLVSRQQAAADEDRRLVRETLAGSERRNEALLAKIDGMTGEIRGLAAEMRASRISIDRAERTIKSAVPNPCPAPE